MGEQQAKLATSLVEPMRYKQDERIELLFFRIRGKIKLEFMKG
jgi:hypothetical protein